MIRPFYTLKLARTKLRSKRGVLLASIIVASLLFAALIATVIVFSGAEKSALEFIKKAGNNNYLVKVSPNIPHEEVDFTNPPSLEDIREIKAFEKKYYEDLQSKYKSLGLEYNKDSEVSAFVPAAYLPETLPEEQRVSLNWASPVIEALRKQKFESYAMNATNKLNDLKAVASKYGASGYYLVDKPSLLPSIPGMRLIQESKEDFGDSEQKTGDSTSYGFYTNAIHNSTYSFTDEKLLSRYLLKTNTSNLKGIPVVVSAQEASALFGAKLGIDKEPEAAGDKRAWLEEMQKKFNGYTYEVCYRNTTEQMLLEKIQRDYAEMKSNENLDGYQKPTRIYDYPAEACGDIILKEDTRTALEKQADVEIENAQKKLGEYVEPSHRIVAFQIVGIKYAQPVTNNSNSVDAYVKNLLISQDESWALDIPIQMYDKLPDELRVDDIQIANSLLVSSASEDFTSRILQFSTVDDVRAFLNNEACSVQSTSCDRQFRASPYGSNYLALDEIGKLFSRIASIAFPVALGLAAIIIWFTISRIMAENRKETAVYRAMGAKRRDVTAIYIVYVLLVALRIATLSIVVGITVAFAAEVFYGKKLTDTAATAFGIVNDAPKFSLFNLEAPLLLVIIGLIFVISILASIQPLIRNVLRAPIRDIREE
tara:strand:+ start:1193 stop:3148 length:1956 start_codon:yes stop_codon:yes gene_type:complete